MAFDAKNFTKQENLDRYSFLWSESRLLVASLALFIGGIPPVLFFNPIPAFYGLLSFLLWIAWLVSGASSVYMVYRWNQNGRTLFGKKENRDTYAFFVSVISGINLGLVGLLGFNMGMRLISSYIVFVVVGVIYLLSAYQLHQSWKSSGEKIF